MSRWFFQSVFPSAFDENGKPEIPSNFATVKRRLLESNTHERTEALLLTKSKAYRQRLDHSCRFGVNDGDTLRVTSVDLVERPFTARGSLLIVKDLIRINMCRTHGRI